MAAIASRDRRSASASFGIAGQDPPPGVEGALVLLEAHEQRAQPERTCRSSEGSGLEHVGGRARVARRPRAGPRARSRTPATSGAASRACAVAVLGGLRRVARLEGGVGLGDPPLRDLELELGHPPAQRRVVRAHRRRPPEVAEGGRPRPAAAAPRTPPPPGRAGTPAGGRGPRRSAGAASGRRPILSRA